MAVERIRGIYDFPPQTQPPLTESLRKLGKQVVAVMRHDIRAVAQAAVRTAETVNHRATRAVDVFEAIAAPYGMRYQEAPPAIEDPTVRVHREPRIKTYNPVTEYAEGMGAIAADASTDEIVRTGLAHLLGAPLQQVEPQLVDERPDLAAVARGSELSMRVIDAAIPAVVVKARVHARDIRFAPLPDTPVGYTDPVVDREVVEFLKGQRSIESLPLGKASGDVELVKGRDQLGDRIDTERVVFREIHQRKPA